MLKVSLLIFVAVTIVTACDNRHSPSSRDIVAVKERNETELLSLSGVVGVGIGECKKKPCIRVFVEKRTPELERRIPKQIEGIDVDVEVTGPIKPLPNNAQ
jgi:hypothetical protein